MKGKKENSSLSMIWRLICSQGLFLIKTILSHSPRKSMIYLICCCPHLNKYLQKSKYMTISMVLMVLGIYKLLWNILRILEINLEWLATKMITYKQSGGLATSGTVNK